MAAEPAPPDDEGKPPLGSWPRFHALVLAILAALVIAYSIVSRTYR